MATRYQQTEKPPKKHIGKWVFRFSLLAIVYIAINAGICWKMIGGYKGGTYTDPASRGVSCNRVEFSNAHGQTLRAIYASTPDRPVIILCHGHHAARGQLSALCTTLYLNCRFGVLAFDFHGSGESDGLVNAAGAVESEDVDAAIEFVQSKGYELQQIGLVGYDMGGIAALGTASKLNELGAVVIVGAAETPLEQTRRAFKRRGIPIHPTASLALAAAKAISGANLDQPDLDWAFKALTRVPVLLVGGELDEQVPPELLRAVFASIPSTAKQLQFIPGRKHADLVGASATTTRQKIKKFLVEYLNE